MQIEYEQSRIRKTYSQNWAAYNQAQTHEKDKFLLLLHELCQNIPELSKQTRGRPRLASQDAVFAVCYKIFSTLSGRRFMSDLRAAQEKGYISKTPHFNSIFNYLDNPQLTPVLRDLIIESSLPLKAAEVDFAVDSSGFTTSKFICWVDHKYGAVHKDHSWVKVHLMCGVRTNIVTAVEIKGKDASDTKLLPDLVDTTAKSFKIREVSGDKAYGSYKNYAAIEQHGGTPYIAFKNIHTGRGVSAGGQKKSVLWSKMYHYFQFNRDEFKQRYHKRSNVETTFSMIKRKFGDHVRSKTDTAQINECLCKILCHNICCLIQESHELGIDIGLAGMSYSS